MRKQRLKKKNYLKLEIEKQQICGEDTYDAIENLFSLTTLIYSPVSQSEKIEGELKIYTEEESQKEKLERWRRRGTKERQDKIKSLFQFYIFFHKK